MKRIKLFEDFKVNNITQEDLVKTIKNGGKIKTSVIKNLPDHNDDEFVNPLSIDGEDIILDIDGSTYTTKIEFITRIEY